MEAMRRLTELFTLRKEKADGECPSNTEMHSLQPSLLPPQLETILLKDGREALVRLMQCSDGPLLYEHIMSMSEESRRLFCPFPFDRLQAEAVAADSQNKQSLRFLSLVGGKPAGYAYFTTRNAKNGFPLVGIGVTDEFQGLGLGRALMERLIETAKAHCFRGLDLNVFKNNYRAQRLYASLGFVFTGDTDGGRQYSMRLYFSPREQAGE